MFNLSPTRLRALVAAFPALRIGVVGDFFLDSYRECDPALDEKSLETGKTCYQVIGYRRQPGAAGNVAANLRALGVGVWSRPWAIAATTEKATNCGGPCVG